MAWSLGHIYAMGALGVVLLIFLYFAATIAMIPAAILNLGAGELQPCESWDQPICFRASLRITKFVGFLYGAFEGYVVTIVGGMLGATGAYYLSKSWLKEKMQKQLAGNETFDKIVRAMGNGGVGTRHTFIVVMLGRLPPFFPFPLFNYAYAITDVSFPIYFWATFIGAPADRVFWHFRVLTLSSVTSDPPRRFAVERILFILHALQTNSTNILEMLRRRR
eukprot:SAG11_NODE_4407_length_1909_cov_1.539779_1_plen_221_part_00